MKKLNEQLKPQFFPDVNDNLDAAEAEAIILKYKNDDSKAKSYKLKLDEFKMINDN